MKDYYKILEVSRNASAEEIKKSYRRLALKYHPDRNSSKEASVLIKEINEAYDVLGDESKRTKYNNRLDAKEIKNTHRQSKSNPKPPPSARRYYQKPTYNFRNWAFKAKFISGFVLIYCGSICLDYFIPITYSDIEIEKVSYVIVKAKRSYSYTKYFLTSKEMDLEIKTVDGSFFPGDVINVKITPIYRNVKEVCIMSDLECKDIDVFNIYSIVFMFVFVSLALATAAHVVKSHEASLRLSIASGLVCIIVFVFQ